MTRDFARKPAAKRAATRPNKRVTKNAPAHSSGKWLWFFSGTLSGAFLMFLVWLSGVMPPAPSSIPTAEPILEPAQASQMPKPRFDFYQLLKESEISVEPPPEKSSSTKPDEEYILQVGSFKRSTDADRMRAELILLNLNAQVEEVKVRTGETWHRVLVGPYTSSSKVAKARSILVSKDINPLLLKRKKQSG